MYNGRSTQPDTQPNQQSYTPTSQPPSTNINHQATQWSRPRKGSYCQYKHQKLNKTNTTLNTYQANNQIIGGGISRNVSRGKIQSSYASRRNSVSFYQKDVRGEIGVGGRDNTGKADLNLRRADYQIGIQKYGSRDLGVDINKKNYTKQTQQIPYQLPRQNRYRPRQQNFVYQYEQLQKKQDKNYLQSSYKKQQIKSYTDIRQNQIPSTVPTLPPGTIISAANVNRKQRNPIYSNIGQNLDMPIRDNGNRLRQRQYQKDYQKYQNTYNNTTNVNTRYQFQKQPQKYQRKQYYEGAKAQTGMGLIDKYQKYDKYDKFDRIDKYDRYDEAQGQYVSRRQRQKNNFLDKSPGRQQKLQEQYPGNLANKTPMFTKSSQKSYITDREREPYQHKKNSQQHTQIPTYPSNIYAQQKHKQGNLTTPTRPKSQYSTIQHPTMNIQEDAVGMSQSRKQMLIERSKMLSQKANQFSASKKIQRNQKQRQKFERNEGQNYEERLQRIKNNKQRFYDSPFKGRVQSSVDLKSKYTRQHIEEPVPNKQPQNNILQKTDINTHKSVQRSQDLMKKLSTITSTSANNSKAPNNYHSYSNNTKNQQNNLYLSSNAPQNNHIKLSTNTQIQRMNRINALNNKISEKINSLISAHSQKQKS